MSHGWRHPKVILSDERAMCSALSSQSIHCFIHRQHLQYSFQHGVAICCQPFGITFGALRPWETASLQCFRQIIDSHQHNHLLHYIANNNNNSHHPYDTLRGIGYQLYGNPSDDFRRH